MPGMYKGEDYDVAGFAVGSVPRNVMNSGMNIGDLVLGITCPGLRYCDFSLLDSMCAQTPIEFSDGRSYTF